MNENYGRDTFLSLLKDEGVTHIFGNPGTTELAIMHALNDHPDLTYVLGLQEAVVVAMADGYAGLGKARCVQRSCRPRPWQRHGLPVHRSHGRLAIDHNRRAAGTRTRPNRATPLWPTG